ncbi:MAG: hypothetical protein ACJ8HI_10085 [Massilia sp.]
MSDLTPPRVLSITEKLLSWPGRLTVTDGDGQPLYECLSNWNFLLPSWTLRQAGNDLAVCRCKFLSFGRTWVVQTSQERYQLTRPLWSWRRRVLVEGGAFDGAELSGNVWDLSFKLTYHNRILARARGKILTLRDRHQIEVLDPSAEAELLTVIMMAQVLIEKRSEQSAD